MDAFITGLLAGYGIAIPVGAIAILIMELGIRRGFRPAFFAGAGAATADLLYAGLAFLGGAALAGAVESVEDPLRIVSGVVLIGIASIGLYRSRRRSENTVMGGANRMGGDVVRIYARFVALTVINPTTIVYFAAVIIGLGVAQDMGTSDGMLFVTGAFLASLSWQTLVAAIGALAGARLSPRARNWISVGGYLLIFALGMSILFR